MAKVDSITPEILREVLRYDPEKGKLFWRERHPSMFAEERHCKSWNTKYANTEAFTANINSGATAYKYGAVFGVNLYAHRVIMSMVYGFPPTHEVDHINGIKSDNRISNLRNATRRENGCNRPAQVGGSGGGVKGITMIKSSGRWQAQIRANGKYKYLGTFDTKAEAHEAYCSASRVLHGDFSRTE